MKQFCRVYVERGTDNILVVYTNDEGVAPEHDPIEDPRDLDIIDVEFDDAFGYMTPDKIREDIMLKDGTPAFKPGVPLPPKLKELTARRGKVARTRG